MENVVGKIFGNVRALEPVESNNSKKYFLCECIFCGYQKVVIYGNMINTKGKKCYCNRYHKNVIEQIGFNVLKIMVDKYNTHKYFIVDSEDVDKIKNYKWNISTKRAVVSHIDNKVKYLHRLIMGVNDPKLSVDHINGNQLDNRKCNLRIVTHNENCMNTALSRNNKSGCNGVCFDKRGKRWTAEIKVNYKKIHLGSYKTKDEAVEARKKAEKEYFGDYGTLASRGIHTTISIDDIIKNIISLE